MNSTCPEIIPVVCPECPEFQCPEQKESKVDPLAPTKEQIEVLKLKNKEQIEVLQLKNKD